MVRWSVLALVLCAGGMGMICGEETGAGPIKPDADLTLASFKPQPKLLQLKVLGLFERTVEPVVLFERKEEIGKASFIRSGAGETQSLSVGNTMSQGDTILIGKDHQVFGRFGDGTAIYMPPFTVMEMTERKQIGEKETSTLLSLFQGALRVNLSRIQSQGPFVVRLPNVREGPIDITGPGSHFFLFPDPLSLNTEWKTVDLMLHVWSGECTVKLPLSKKATSDIVVTMDKGTTVTVPSGNALRMSFRYEPLEEPKFGGPVYMLFLDVTKLEELPPPRIVPDTPPPPPPPPPPSAGG